MYSVILVSSAKHVTESFNSMELWVNQSFNLKLVTSHLDEALKERPDVLIYPFNSENSSGCELARKLFIEKSKTKIILYGRKSFDSVKSAINSRAWGYLSMPLERDDFFSLFINLRQYLDSELREHHKHLDLNQLKEEFFPKLLSNAFSDKYSFYKEFSLFSLPVSPEADSCSIVKFTINNFSGFLEDKWKYGKDALYVAVNNFIVKNRPDIISLPINTVKNEIHIAVFRLTDEDINQQYSEINKNLYEIMGIELSYSILRSYSSFSDILNTEEIKFLSENLSVIPIENIKAENHDLSTENNTVKLAKNYINQNFNKEICLDDVAQHVDLSSAYFSRLFKQNTGENFIDYLIKIRMEKGKHLLAETHLKTYEVGANVGYNNSKYFCKLFKNYTGYTPTEYRSKIKRAH